MRGATRAWVARSDNAGPGQSGEKRRSAPRPWWRAATHGQPRDSRPAPPTHPRNARHARAPQPTPFPSREPLTCCPPSVWLAPQRPLRCSRPGTCRQLLWQRRAPRPRLRAATHGQLRLLWPPSPPAALPFPLTEEHSLEHSLAARQPPPWCCSLGKGGKRAPRPWWRAATRPAAPGCAARSGGSRAPAPPSTSSPAQGGGTRTGAEQGVSIEHLATTLVCLPGMALRQAPRLARAVGQAALCAAPPPPPGPRNRARGPGGRRRQPASMAGKGSTVPPPHGPRPSPKHEPVAPPVPPKAPLTLLWLMCRPR